MLPAPAAPRMASVSACATASASEWPARPCGVGNGDAAEDERAARDEAVGVVADADAGHAAATGSSMTL